MNKTIRNILKKKNRKKLFIVGLLILAFVFSSPYMFGTEDTRNIFDYGSVSYQIVPLITGNPSGLSSGDTVYANTHSVKVTFTWTSSSMEPDEYDFHALLALSIWDIAEDVYSVKSGKIYTFEFDLTKCHAGTFGYYIQLYATGGADDQWFYSGKGISFNVVNLVETTDLPEFIELPEDIDSQPVGYAYTLKWKFKYDASATLTLQQDGVVIDTETFDGSPFTSDYFYVFNPAVEGDWRFRFTLTPDNWLHAPIWDEMDIGFITWEDYTINDGVPEGFENTGVTLDGTMVLIPLPLHQEWLLSDDAPADVRAYSRTGDMTIRLVAQETLLGLWDTILGDTKIVMFHTDGERLEFPMHTETGVGLNIFGLKYTSWKEVVINLNAIPAGEYYCEIRAIHGGNLYNISAFELAVNIQPWNFLAIGTGTLLMLAVSGVVMIIVARQVKGWWHYQGKYGRVK